MIFGRTNFRDVYVRAGGTGRRDLDWRGALYAEEPKFPCAFKCATFVTVPSIRMLIRRDLVVRGGSFWQSAAN